jgi:mevalonate kinase
MNTTGNPFPAKILLFGEYTILLGSTALSIPYHAFSAELTLPRSSENISSRKQVTSNQHLFTFYNYLAGLGDTLTQIIDFERFHHDLIRGLYLQSTIPAGYGLGSSGALVAAVFERFAMHLPSQDEIAADEGMLRLKNIFSEMEAFFHGRSSGFDPSVSFLKIPLLLRQDGVPQQVKLPKGFLASGAGIFLLDTGQTGKTAPLVKLFLDRFKPDGRITDEGKILALLINDVVNAFLDFPDHTFRNLMKRLSVIQTEEFKPMIPEKFLSLWSEGIENDFFYLKLCGSGGGGYLLGFAPDLKKAMTFLRDRGSYPILITELSSGILQ